MFNNILPATPLLLLLLPAACSTDLDSDEADEDGGLTTLAVVADPYIVNNGISKEYIVNNGITDVPDNLDAFITSPLSTEGLDAIPIVNSVATRMFLRYTVECALDSSQRVGFGGQQFQGALGACPEWNEDAPTAQCLEAVSGCLMARNNKLGRRVQISPRTDWIGIGGPVPADTYKNQPFADPVPIASFAPCNGGALFTGENRNCGWPANNAWVGTCKPGRPVAVGAGARAGNCLSPLGTGLGNPVMRACKGTAGCDLGSAEHIASNDNACNSMPAINFSCPATGVFTVMVGSWHPLGGSTGEAAVDSKPTAYLPASVEQVFTVKEGAFYGDLFDESSFNPQVVISGSGATFTYTIGPSTGTHTGIGDPYVYLREDAWACHDPAWLADDAYLYSRLCAIPDIVYDQSGSPVPDAMKPGVCLAKPIGPCNVDAIDSSANRCAILDTQPNGNQDYDNCADGHDVQRAEPMTVFLNGPCDLLAAGERHLCQREPGPM